MNVSEIRTERLSDGQAPPWWGALVRLFGNSPEFWLNAQRAVDLWDATQAIRRDVELIRPLVVAECLAQAEAAHSQLCRQLTLWG